MKGPASGSNLAARRGAPAPRVRDRSREKRRRSRSATEDMQIPIGEFVQLADGRSGKLAKTGHGYMYLDVGDKEGKLCCCRVSDIDTSSKRARTISTSDERSSSPSGASMPVTNQALGWLADALGWLVGSRRRGV